MTELCISPNSPWLAPLAGYSDLPFRLLCREYGARVACTEMVSAKGLVYGSNGTRDLLLTNDADAPLVVQLFGNEKIFIEKSIIYLQDLGFKYFDLNMGCSVHKVNKTGCGAAMLKDLENSLEVAKSMITLAEDKCVGFKIRLGWTDESHVWKELALRLQDLGAGWITLHPRTAKQGFSGNANWQYLKELQELLEIPLIASGDLLTAKAGIECLQKTDVQGLMYARGAMQNPAIFDEHIALYNGQELAQFDADKLLKRIRRHIELAKEFSSERVAMLKMRTFVPRYVHHLHGVKYLRQCLIQCKTWQEMDDILEEFFQQTTRKSTCM